MEKKNFNLLDQFNDRKCEISFHSLLDNSLSATYVYDLFSYELTDEYICLKDQSDDDCILTSIPLIKIDSVVNLNNDVLDVYSDVVSLKCKCDDYIVSVCTLERKFIYPRCYKCGKEILDFDSIWYIHGNANYGSHYDSPEDNLIINSLSFCDDCVHSFIGEVGEQDE